MNVEANDVINNLLEEITTHVNEKAVMKAQIKQLNNKIEELEEKEDAE